MSNSLSLREVGQIFIRLIRIYLFYCTSHSLLKTLNGRKTYSLRWEKLLQRGWISWQRWLIDRDLCCNNLIKEGSALMRGFVTRHIMNWNVAPTRPVQLPLLVIGREQW